MMTIIKVGIYDGIELQIMNEAGNLNSNQKIHLGSDHVRFYVRVVTVKL